jgi:DNA-binding MarR family transcriptional regulator
MTETTDGNIYAPWDMQTVRNLNRFQNLSFIHPYTCDNASHGGSRRLVAGPDGWHCSNPTCEYTQNWASALMADPSKWPHGPNPWQSFGVAVSKTAAEAIVDARVAAERLVSILGNETLGKITAELVDAPARPAEAERWCCNGNAEECALCTAEITATMPYPWICQGDHTYTPRNRRSVLVAATDEGREALKAAMKRLRIYVAMNKGIEDDVEDESDEMASEALQRAAQRAKTVVKRLDEVSTVQAWANEDDLAEALGSFGDGYRHAQRDALRALSLDRIAAREGSEGHVYLSTGCLHDDHAYCQGTTGLSGAKRPAECKQCGAKCICECHQGDEARKNEKPLSCGLCWTENGQSFHCHPECHHGYASINPGTIYRHFKGDLYEVLGTAFHTEKDERLVVYRSHDPNGEPGTWARPLAMFHDDVTVNGERMPRFKLVGTVEELDLSAMRKLASERLLAIALERTEREWICCDPIDVSHPLCVQGEATRTMLKALLTDDETVFPPNSDVLDEVMRLIQGIGDYRMQRSVLSEAEVRELYRGALQLGYEDCNAGVGTMTMEKLVSRVVDSRDRELARNRQRLSLADQAAVTFIRDHEAHDQSVEEAVAVARREERVKVLDEVLAKIHGEICSPIEGIAFNNTLLWLKKAKKDASTA